VDGEAIFDIRYLRLVIGDRARVWRRTYGPHLREEIASPKTGSQ
jgi:hypothetical protein